MNRAEYTLLIRSLRIHRNFLKSPEGLTLHNNEVCNNITIEIDKLMDKLIKERNEVITN